MEAMNKKTMNNVEKKQRNDILKAIAMFTMLVDHIGYLFFPSMMIFRTIGRIAFPIFAYLIGIGYEYTSSLKKYMMRLLIFALITQIPYSFFNRSVTFEPFNLNILFTLLIGLVFIYLVNDSIKILKSKLSITYFKLVANLGFMLLVLYLNEYLKFLGYGRGLEYGWYGIALILIFYYNKKSTLLLIINYIILTFIHAFYNIFFSLIQRNNVSIIGNLIENTKLIINYIFGDMNEILTLNTYFFQGRSIMSLYFIKGFNKEKFYMQLNPWFGYLFYPGHMSLLILIKFLMK